MVLYALRNALAPDSSLAAAAVAYFSLFSFFPLVVFTTSIAGTWLEPILGRSDVIAQIDRVAPALGYLLQTQLQRIVELRETVTGIALITLLWSSSSIFYVLTRTLDRLWKVEQRSFWQQRGVAIITMLIVSTLLLLASVAHSFLVSMIELLTPSFVLQQFSSLPSQIIVFAISLSLFALLYRFLPHADVTWWDVWPGAVSGGILWEVLKRAFFFYATHYLTQARLTALVYGSVATIIGFMAWSYVSSLIFLFGAHLNLAYWQRRRGAGASQT